MSRRTLAFSGALAIALAAPAAADAVPRFVEPLKPCYVTAETPEGPRMEGMDIVTDGFSPNASVDLTVDGAPYPGGDNLQANGLGQLPIPPVPAPFVAKGSRAFTITLTERGNAANTVSTTTKSTALGVNVKPKEAKPSDRIRFKGRGFTDDAPIWAHYIHKGKVRKTVRMARRPRACGGFKKRARQIPLKRPRLGTWTIQFDQYEQFVDPRVTRIVFVRLAIRLRLVRPR